MRILNDFNSETSSLINSASGAQYTTIERPPPTGTVKIGNYSSSATGSWEAEVVVVIVEGREGNASRDSPPPSSSSHSRTTRSPLRRKWDAYVGLVEQYPLTVKTISASALFLLADAAAQGIELLRQPGSVGYTYDVLRSLRFASFGLFGAPWSHFYFSYLDAVLPPTDDPWTRTTLLKLVIDQFLQAPILLAIMISSLTAMQGHGVVQVRQDLVSDFMPTLVANWKLWIPASAINLAFVKPSLRVLYVNVVFMVWTIILSLMLNETR